MLTRRSTDTLVQRVRNRLGSDPRVGPERASAEQALRLLELRIEVLRDALDWYADLVNYSYPTGGGRRVPSLISNDRGGRARAALQEVPK